MLKPSLLLVGILVIVLAGCASQDKAACPGKPCKQACQCQKACTCKQAGKTAALDAAAYTTTRAINVDGELKGFLCTLDAVPITADAGRKIPAGSAFIKDLEFNNLGFITPKGELWRFKEGMDPERVHQAGLVENLAVFFGTSERGISLQDL